ncbi:Syndecan [Halotydeus destructor]|nr:Syndecan [Halotydeus destructor]
MSWSSVAVLSVLVIVLAASSHGQSKGSQLDKLLNRKPVECCSSDEPGVARKYHDDSRRKKSSSKSSSRQSLLRNDVYSDDEMQSDQPDSNNGSLPFAEGSGDYGDDEDGPLISGPTLHVPTLGSSGHWPSASHPLPGIHKPDRSDRGPPPDDEDSGPLIEGSGLGHSDKGDHAGGWPDSGGPFSRSDKLPAHFDDHSGSGDGEDDDDDDDKDYGGIFSSSPETSSASTSTVASLTTATTTTTSTTSASTTTTSTTTPMPTTIRSSTMATSTTTTKPKKNKKHKGVDIVKPSTTRRPTSTTPAYEDFDDEDEDDDEEYDDEYEDTDDTHDIVDPMPEEETGHENKVDHVTSTKSPPYYSSTDVIKPITDDTVHTFGNEVSVLGNKHDDKVSFFARPGILAAVIGGAVVGLLCAILLVMLILYNLKKKDEGAYAMEEHKRSSNGYLKAPTREYYA